MNRNPSQTGTTHLSEAVGTSLRSLPLLFASLMCLWGCSAVPERQPDPFETAVEAPPTQPTDPAVTAVGETQPTAPAAPEVPPTAPTAVNVSLDGSATGSPFVEPPEVASFLAQAQVLVTLSETPPDEPILETAKRALELVKWKDAAASLEGAIAVVPNSPSLRLALAKAKIRLGLPSEALTHASVAWNSDPTRMDTATLVVQLLCRTGQKGQAQEFASKVAATDRKDGNRQNIRVSALLACGEYDQAASAAREILPLDEVNPEIMKNLAKAYYFQNKYEMALYALTRASEFKPDDYEIVFVRALVLQKTQSPAVAEGAYRLVLQMKPDHPESHNNLALILYETGNYADAAAHFQLAFTYAPGFREARLNFANSLRGLRWLAQADAYYRTLLEEYPDFIDVYYNLGMLYIEEEWGNQSKLALLSQGQQFLQQYATLSGVRGAAKSHLDSLLKETADRIKEEERKVADLEAEARENAEKLEKFSAMATGVLVFYKDAVALMKDSADLAAGEGRQADADALNSALGEFQNQFLQSVLGIQTTLNNREGGQLEEMLMSLSPGLSPWPGKLKGMSALLVQGRPVPELPVEFIRLSSDELEAVPEGGPAPEGTGESGGGTAPGEGVAPAVPPDGAPVDDSGPIPLEGSPVTPDAGTGPMAPVGPGDGSGEDSGPLPLEPSEPSDGTAPPVVPEG